MKGFFFSVRGIGRKEEKEKKKRNEKSIFAEEKKTNRTKKVVKKDGRKRLRLCSEETEKRMWIRLVAKRIDVGS